MSESVVNFRREPKFIRERFDDIARRGGLREVASQDRAIVDRIGHARFAAAGRQVRVLAPCEGRARSGFAGERRLGAGGRRWGRGISRWIGRGWCGIGCGIVGRIGHVISLRRESCPPEDWGPMVNGRLVRRV
jgi:hypothetical protein